MEPRGRVLKSCKIVTDLFTEACKELRGKCQCFTIQYILSTRPTNPTLRTSLDSLGNLKEEVHDLNSDYNPFAELRKTYRRLLNSILRTTRKQALDDLVLCVKWVGALQATEKTIALVKKLEERVEYAEWSLFSRHLANKKQKKNVSSIRSERV